MENKMIENLRNNPIFQMSLGSKELFHSNFLAWIFDKSDQKAFALHILNQFPIINNCITDITESPSREKYNIDLTLKVKFNDGNDKIIVIENKVKSLPDKHQLSKYKDKNKADFYYLLTLVKPDFNTDGWQTITYGDLSNFINSSLDKIVTSVNENESNTFLTIIKLYNEFITSLQSIANQYFMLNENEIFNYNENIINTEFKSIRINDLYLKLKYDSIKQKISKKINDLELDLIVANPWNNENLNIENGYVINTGFSRAQAMVDFKYIVKSFKVSQKYNYFILGIQLQGNQLRYVCEVIGTNFNKSLVVNLAKELYENNLWLKSPIDRPNGLFKHIDMGEGRKKESPFPSYLNTFFYKYDLVSSEAKTDILIDFIVQLINHIVDNRDIYVKKFDSLTK